MPSGHIYHTIHLARVNASLKRMILSGILKQKRRGRDLNPRMLAHTGSQGPRPTELGDLCKKIIDSCG